MSPHATHPDPLHGASLRRTAQPPNERRVHATEELSRSSLLKRCDDDEVHDLICVGFGPASLAIAVALHDEVESRNPILLATPPKVRFIERQERFRWHAGMLLPGTKMQITFIKDLATLRNPRSEFTFLNYLHRNGRLVPFTNLGTFLPQRIEYEDYMRWSADHFIDIVDYGYDVEAVDVGSVNPKSGAVEYFQVAARNRSSGEVVVRRAKNVVIAVGGRPHVPQCLRTNHPRVVHSSQYATTIDSIFPAGSAPRSVAVIGAGQSAAEVFYNIPSRFPEATSYLLIKGTALRPSDDSPFVNEIFDPSRVDDVYSQDADVRAEGLALDRGTNYGVVRLELLEEIYSTLYSYRVRYAQEPDWPQQILTHRTVTGVQQIDNKSGSRMRLTIQDDSGKHNVQEISQEETLDVDLVVVASGYERNAHEAILHGLKHLRATGDHGNVWRVNRDYSIEFADGRVASGAGIWLQGCNESTHGLSDTLLSILATRGGEIVSSIFGHTTHSSEARPERLVNEN